MSTIDAGAEEAARPHLVQALRAMLVQAERMPLRLVLVNGSGLMLTLQHGPVRCVLVADLPDSPAMLSPRELEVARLVAHGATNRAIATRLEISTWTVSTHLRRIFAKLRVGTRAEMVNALFAVPDTDPDTGPVPASGAMPADQLIATAVSSA
jgi:DNA-binding CsgD family transcriptional regulator